MRQQEVEAFARTLQVRPAQIEVCDLLSQVPVESQLARTDMVLLGGSGHYSVTGQGEWLDRALDALRLIHARRMPTFASCWGFQAMARALGGQVVHDLARAELGTHRLRLTEAGRHDPVFGRLPIKFRGQMGHEDRVAELPPGAVLLARSDRVENQAYRFENLPIYCTQFHPELNRADLLARVCVYPEYVERISDLSIDRFGELCEDTPETATLLVHFVRHVFGF